MTLLLPLPPRMVESFYDQANFLNYVNIPLTLATGTYIYAIYDEFGDLIEGGKFVKAN